MLRKRHHSEEVSTKLREADDMAAKGKTQQEIAGALGVSVMTVHRWRKRQIGELVRPSGNVASHPNSDGTSSAYTSERARSERQERAAELELENFRLRQLVADLMLEKMKLEEEIGEHKPILSRPRPK